MDVPGPTAVPTRGAAAWWRARVTAHQLRRLAADLRSGPRRHRPAAALLGAPLLATSRTPLWSTDPGPEWMLEAGKVENLRQAIRALHGIEVGPGQLLSFWAQVGPPWAMRGFVEGREIREGCIVPSIAGGLCQLSNALYDAARRAGLEIVERHAHSRIVPGSAAAAGHDATVMWNYVDLRVRAPHAFRVEAQLGPDALVLRLQGFARPIPSRESAQPAPDAPLRVLPTTHGARSCMSCEQPDCHRVRPAPAVLRGHRAWLVDGRWPEHDAWLRAEHGPTDVLMLPLDGRRLGRARYAWSSEGFAAVHAFPALTIQRALASRRLATQGAARQRALLRHEARLAAAMARRLPASATHLVVTQTLLPHLWRAGALGGRCFDVLMTRPPLWMLHAALDRAARLHPDSPTLADFRADPAAVALEREALAAAERIVTPHAGIAREFGARAVRVGWDRPPQVPARVDRARSGPPRVLFPASTLGRKGAYELREALRDLDITLMRGGPVLEGPDFWGRPVPTGGIDDAELVVLPAHAEAAPRRLLDALARGRRVVASDACGLDPEPGLTLVPAGDAVALREAIIAALALGRSAASVA